MVMIIAFLVVFGLILGSFVNALVFRLHMQEKQGNKHIAKSRKGKHGPQASSLNPDDLSIVKGRSMCVHCGHELAWYDLVPVFSWLSLGGKCRYCKKPISAQYPVVEFTTAALFVLSYIFWPYQLLTINHQILFAGWLVILTGFVVLIVYDLRWMLLPDRIVYPLTILALSLAGLDVVTGGGGELLLQTLLSVAIAGGIFYLIFQISGGRWIGGGDVKLGLLIGLVLRDPLLAFLMLLVASSMGTLVVLPGLLLGKITPKTHIPFGPFLVAATILVFLLGPTVIDWYRDTLLLI